MIQFGSKKGSSSTHALLSILQPVYKALDNSQYYARIPLTDFPKAFDHIDHTIVLNKMESNGNESVLIPGFMVS